MDIVYIRDLEVQARIGIYEWERQILQTVRIDLEMGWDNKIPAASDNIEDTLNYKETAKQVQRLVQKTEHLLVEKLAEDIAQLLVVTLQIPWVSVTLGKPFAVTGSSEVGVRIERSQADYQQHKPNFV